MPYAWHPDEKPPFPGVNYLRSHFPKPFPLLTKQTIRWANINTAAAQKRKNDFPMKKPLRTIFEPCLVSLSLLLGSVMQSAMSAEVRNSPSLQILGIHELLSKENQETKALLELQIKNNENGTVVVPFRSLMSRNAYKAIDTAHKGAWHGNVNGRSENFYVADFAQIKYSWSDSDGITCAQGVHDLSQESMSISGKGTSTLFVPIKLPDREGAFILSLKFDNRSLSLPILASNRPLSVRYSFFEQSADARVNIKRLSN